MISNMMRFGPSIPALFEGLDEVLSTDYPAFAPGAGRLRAYPQVNMGVTENSVEIYLFAPGMDPAELDVSLEKNLLSVTGERKLEAVDEQATVRRERFAGKFKRVITLPEDVDPGKTEAVYRDGVLHISVAKREETQPRKIQINA